MRPWRLSIEFGREDREEASRTATPTATSAPAPLHHPVAWSALTEARRNLINAQSKGDPATVNQINMWIGGALSIMASLTGEDAKELDAKLKADVPSGAPAVAANDDGTLSTDSSRASFYPVERVRPAPSPGAPRPISPEDLTLEERQSLGVRLDDDPPLPAYGSEPSAAPEKKPAKRAAAKKSAPKKAASKRSTS